MERQLVLLDDADLSPAAWRLDPETCDLGRRNVAEARKRLRAGATRQAA